MSRLEPGCACCDLTRDPVRPTSFYLYEVFDNLEAFRSHELTSHSLAWSEYRTHSGHVLKCKVTNSQAVVAQGVVGLSL